MIMDADTAFLRGQILELKVKIDDCIQALHDKVERIRDDARNYERDAIDRSYYEIEPMRRQMEAMIFAVSNYESLRVPMPVIIKTNTP